MSGLDLIHIGFHKCASTTLQKGLFANHPQIVYNRSAQLALDNKLDYQGRDITDNSGNLKVINTAETLCGVDYQSFDRSGRYDEIPDTIYQNWPGAKILIIIRNQVDLIRSYYKESLVRYNTTYKIDYMIKKVFANRIFNFDLFVGRYLDRFKKENLLVLPVEMLKQDAARFYREICHFLDIDSNIISEYQSRNISGNKKANEAIRFLNKTIFLKESTKNHRRKRRIRKAMNSILGGKGDYLNDSQKKEIRDNYQESNRSLASLMDTDFKNMGYFW